MAAARYAFTGGTEMWYQAYRDDETGKMLIARPGGGPYSMTPVEEGFPVPPNDGRWQEDSPPPPSPPPVSPSVSSSVTAPPAPASAGGE